VEHPDFDGWMGKFLPEGAESWVQVSDRAEQFMKVIISKTEISHLLLLSLNVTRKPFLVIFQRRI
jgi:hypothetical protein